MLKNTEINLYKIQFYQMVKKLIVLKDQCEANIAGQCPALLYC